MTVAQKARQRFFKKLQHSAIRFIRQSAPNLCVAVHKYHGVCALKLGHIRVLRFHGLREHRDLGSNGNHQTSTALLANHS